MADLLGPDGNEIMDHQAFTAAVANRDCLGLEEDQACRDLLGLGRHLVEAWASNVPPTLEPLSGNEIHAVAARGVVGGLLAEVALVGSQLPVSTRRTPETLRLGLQQIARFVRRLQHDGVETLGDVTKQHVQSFVEEGIEAGYGYEDPSVSTMHGRRDSMRLLFRIARQLHVVGPAFDPTADLVLPPLTEAGIRPLTNDEESLCRLFAAGTGFRTRGAAAWAIGQATGTTGEQVKALIGDVHLDDGTIDLRGLTKRQRRSGQLTPWGVEQLAARIAYLESRGGGPTTPLIRGPRASARSAPIQTSEAVRRVILEAGLTHERDITPSSLPNWAGRQIYEATGKIEDAAKALGMISLDTTAKAIRLDWR